MASLVVHATVRTCAPVPSARVLTGSSTSTVPRISPRRQLHTCTAPDLVPTYKKSPSGLAVTHVTPGMSEKVYVSASGDGPVSSSTTTSRARSSASSTRPRIRWSIMRNGIGSAGTTESGSTWSHGTPGRSFAIVV
eukprot:CAMPEP_0180238954 /NCGR_PEP_ID=MMETSP0987-20121128/31244_2 /TAXON_ID=697907 /ORGANISM="non described non described, Strain CCMP2293" /LENGTH=135 /DNA_ID=CAMNT_0022205593 /DNA_START=38 /DNA_END=445 /DNA_ORIENTATION=-